jgi:hypothetical protein
VCEKDSPRRASERTRLEARVIKSWELWLLAAIGTLVGAGFGFFLGASTSGYNDVPVTGSALLGATLGAILGFAVGYGLGSALRGMKPGP